MRSLDAVGLRADTPEKPICNRIREPSASFVSRTLAMAQKLGRSWSGATTAVLRRVLHSARNSTEMMPNLSVPRPLKFALFVHLLLTIAVCLFPVGAGAEGRIVIFPNLDAKHGIGLPIDKHTMSILSGLDGTGVSVVTPRGGMIFTVDLDAEVSGILTGSYRVLSDSGVSEVKSDDGVAVWHMPDFTPHVTLQSAGLSHSTTFPEVLESLKEKYGAKHTDHADALKILKRPYIDFGNGLLIQIPIFDPYSQKFYGADRQPFPFNSVLTSLDSVLPGLSPEENMEFRDLATRLGKLSTKKLERLKELFDRGISVPTNTTPTAPPKVRPQIVFMGSPVCPNGKELPIYCKYFKKWKLPECTCE